MPHSEQAATSRPSVAEPASPIKRFAGGKFRQRKPTAAAEITPRYLAENLLAFFNHDYHRVATLHVESSRVPANTRVEEFEPAIRTVCEPIFEKPLSEISFGHFLLNLFQTARRFDMEVQPQLVLLHAQHRRAGPSALSRTRSLDHRQALPGRLDG